MTARHYPPSVEATGTPDTTLAADCLIADTALTGSTWLPLWRWYTAMCAWICACGCIGPDCCRCCVWDPETAPDAIRERQIIEHAAQIGALY